MGALVVGTLVLTAAPAAFAASLTSVQISALTSLLSSFGVDSGTIAHVEGILSGSGSGGSSGTGGVCTAEAKVCPDGSSVGRVGPSCNFAACPGAPVSSSPAGSPGLACKFTGDLSVGSRGTDVTCLQNYLIKSGIPIAAGVTGTFGTQTQSAVMMWQKAHGLPASGYFGNLSRGTFNGSINTSSSAGVSGKISPGTAYVPQPASPGMSAHAQLDAEMSAINANMQGLDNDIQQGESASNSSDDPDQ